jgi:ABC-2 type transport system permease protein
MRKVFVITYYDIRLFLQSPSNLVQLTVMPMAFIFIMGMAFGGSADTTNIRVDVLDMDGSQASGALIDALKMANPNIIVCPADNGTEDVCDLGTDTTLTAELAQERLNDRVSFATLTIPSGYADALVSGGTTTLVFQSDPNLTAPTIIRGSLDSIIRRVGGASVAARLSTEVADNLGLVSQEDQSAFFTERYAEAEAAWGPPAPIVIEAVGTLQDRSDDVGTGFEQSAPGMASMFVMMNVLGLATLMVQERLDGTLPRLIVMPISKAQLLGGKVLRGFLLGFFQFLLMLVFGSMLGVNFGSDPVAIVLVVITYVAAVTAMGIAMATLVKTPDQAGGISILAAMTLAPLGGAWWTLEIVPKLMQTIGHISPIAWLMDAFNEMIFFGGGLADVALSIVVLLGMALVFFAFGIMRFRYE